MTSVKTLQPRQPMKIRPFEFHRTINRELLPHPNRIDDISKMQKIQFDYATIYLYHINIHSCWNERAIREVYQPQTKVICEKEIPEGDVED
ncbi:hypothetical protein KC330_g3617 [Hortaea werneckii]|nr:hypothetical protein KC330_g3617 [Hortaea werneckii]